MKRNNLFFLVILGIGLGITLHAQSIPLSEPDIMPPDLVLVEGGTFQMGSLEGEVDEKPLHTVRVKSFYMAKYEVTQKEWHEVMETTIEQQRNMAGIDFPLRGKGDRYPIYYVNWYEAIAYCNKRSSKESLAPAYRNLGNVIICDFNAPGYRLPTEAEWEYAAKGGNRDTLLLEYAGGNNVDVLGWYEMNSRRGTHEVGTKWPNSLGLYDMSGNVWEWCWDWYGSYSTEDQIDPEGAFSGVGRVIRGGSWISLARILRSANRASSTPLLRYNFLGFRVVRSEVLGIEKKDEKE